MHPHAHLPSPIPTHILWKHKALWSCREPIIPKTKQLKIIRSQAFSTEQALGYICHTKTWGFGGPPNPRPKWESHVLLSAWGGGIFLAAEWGSQVLRCAEKILRTLEGKPSP